MFSNLMKLSKLINAQKILWLNQQSCVKNIPRNLSLNLAVQIKA